MFPLKSMLKFLLLQWGYIFSHRHIRPLGIPLDGSEILTVCVSLCLIAMFLEYRVSVAYIITRRNNAIFQSNFSELNLLHVFCN